MTFNGPPEVPPCSETRQIPRLPQANAITAIIVAIASLSTAVAVLMLVQDEAGMAAAGAIATAGLALAGKLGTPNR